MNKKKRVFKKYAKKISEYFFDDNEIHYVFVLALMVATIGALVGIIA